MTKTIEERVKKIEDELGITDAMEDVLKKDALAAVYRDFKFGVAAARRYARESLRAGKTPNDIRQLLTNRGFKRRGEPDGDN